MRKDMIKELTDTIHDKLSLDYPEHMPSVVAWRDYVKQTIDQYIPEDEKYVIVTYDEELGGRRLIVNHLTPKNIVALVITLLEELEKIGISQTDVTEMVIACLLEMDAEGVTI